MKRKRRLRAFERHGDDKPLSPLRWNALAHRIRTRRSANIFRGSFRETHAIMVTRHYHIAILMPRASRFCFFLALPPFTMHSLRIRFRRASISPMPEVSRAHYEDDAEPLPRPRCHTLRASHDYAFSFFMRGEHAASRRRDFIRQDGISEVEVAAPFFVDDDIRHARYSYFQPLLSYDAAPMTPPYMHQRSRHSDAGMMISHIYTERRFSLLLRRSITAPFREYDASLSLNFILNSITSVFMCHEPIKCRQLDSISHELLRC